MLAELVRQLAVLHGDYRYRFRSREDQCLFKFFLTALGAGVEKSQGIDLIAKKIQPQGKILRRRPNIQNSTPSGKLSGLHYDVAIFVADTDQVG